MTDKAYVAGVGMVPFQKPGKSESYDVMATAATRSALADAGLDYDKVQQAYVAMSMATAPAVSAPCTMSE